jgi:hypothetical protein
MPTGEFPFIAAKIVKWTDRKAGEVQYEFGSNMTIGRKLQSTEDNFIEMMRILLLRTSNYLIGFNYD